MSYIKIDIIDDSIRCEISDRILDILSYDDMPLSFEVLPVTNSEIVYKTELNKSMWASWKPFRDHNARVLTKNGILLKEFNYDYRKEDLEIYEFWDYFTKINKTSIGLILGAGDGTWGEWVKGVLDNDVECYLVEASDISFDKLEKTYNNKSKIHCIKELISTDGIDYKFYNQGGLSTINSEYLSNFNEGVTTDVVIKKSKKFSDLLKDIGKIDWIRFDVEGIDYDLIMSIDSEYYKKLKMIQYEHHNLEKYKKEKIEDLFINIGFDKFEFNIDTIFIKNN